MGTYFITAKRALVGAFAFSLVILPLAALAQTSYTTGFEAPTFVLGDAQGQNGWGYLPNSPAKGVIEPAPPGSPPAFGSQSLAIRTNDVAFFGVANQFYSARVDPAGENGSTIGGVIIPAQYNRFAATFYYQAPATPVISTRADGRFAELDPSSKGTAAGDASNRYAQIRVINDTNTAAGKVKIEMGWYTSAAATFNVSTVATGLNWGEWYRFDYILTLCDGLSGSAPNDMFKISVTDLNGATKGTALGSTWESAWKTGSFGGGSTARALNGFDFWTQTGPNNALVGYIDRFAQAVSTVPDPCLVPTAAPVSVSGRVLNAAGHGVRAARVTILVNDIPRTVVTNAFGYFRFDALPGGQSGIVQVSVKGWNFAPRFVSLTDDVTGFDFAAQ